MTDDNVRMNEFRINIHLNNAVIPALTDPDNVRIIAPNTKMFFDDRAIQREDVTVIAGPLMEATSDGVYYLCQMVDDDTLWLISHHDLHDPR